MPTRPLIPDSADYPDSPESIGGSDDLNGPARTGVAGCAAAVTDDPTYPELEQTYGDGLAQQLIRARQRIAPILARRGIGADGALPRRVLKDRETLERWASTLLVEVMPYLPACSLVGMSLRQHKPLSVAVACARDDGQPLLATVLAGIGFERERLPKTAVTADTSPSP